MIVKDGMYNGCGDGDINLEDNVYLEMILILDMLMKMMFIKKMVLKMVMVMKTHLLQTVQQNPDQSHACESNDVKQCLSSFSQQYISNQTSLERRTENKS